MHQIKNFLLFLVCTSVFSSCIEPYSLNIGGQTSSKYVVYGQVSDQEGYQTVSVSMSSTIDEPDYVPLANCDVRIIDNQNNIFRLSEFKVGTYRVWIGKENLIPGNSYQVSILTPSGVEIISDFDEMHACPEIDSIYYVQEEIQTTNPIKPIQGIQFYIDVNGGTTNSRFYRWELVETWEHHAAYPITLFWNTKALINFNPPDYSKFYCWSTRTINNIYTLSTKDLVENKYRMNKLQFVDNLTQRLTYCYSLFLSQFALSEAAYNYWDKLRINNMDQGGLYDSQPLQIKGNLRSNSNPELEVLGFFCATAVRSKRIFVQNVEKINLLYPQCDPRPREPNDMNRSKRQYLISLPDDIYILEDGCVECNISSGTTTKPDFWPY